MKVQLPSPILVDRRNLHSVLPRILRSVETAELVGLDTEFCDPDRHEGLKRFLSEKDDGSTRNDRTCFDMRRLHVTGFSVWPRDCDEAYYVNLGHADEENRIAFGEVLPILEAGRGKWVAHKAPVEINVFRHLGHELGRVFCSLQLCVSAYNPDTYREEDFAAASLDAFKPVMRDLIEAGLSYGGDRDGMTSFQAETLSKVLSKSSKARHSYNGFVGEMALGYSLKKAVLSWFGYRMATFRETLGGRLHMGRLTGEEARPYACDDAVWALRLFDRVSSWLLETNPEAMTAYLEQELPMIPVYADLWRDGLRVNPAAIQARKRAERAAAAAAYRRLRAEVRKLLPFRPELDGRLLKSSTDWYEKNGLSYRRRIEAWASLPDEADDLGELLRVAGPTSAGWAKELGRPKPTGPNFSYWATMRVLLYDLAGAKPVLADRKVQSDGEARGKVKERHPVAAGIVGCLGELAGIEQRMKLFILPYEMLTDPETGRIYPEVTSMLATRRLAASNPNDMQMSKQGESSYVRGFVEADTDEEVLISLDWAGIELVEIAEESGDPAFLEAYGQLPHKDLHSKATAGILSFELGRAVTPEMVKALPRMSREEVLDLFGPKVLVDTKGRSMSPGDAYKFHRGTDGGKGANFNYWYSGALGTLAERRGWTSAQMWAATEAYRQEFPVAEAWRLETIRRGCELGHVRLPDGHRRYRFEATDRWAFLWAEKWRPYWEVAGEAEAGLRAYLGEMSRKIQVRAKNQIVNAKIQGGCATLLKRSAVRVRPLLKDLRARFAAPIHDEMVFSVHHTTVVPFIHEAKRVMCHHPDLFKRTVPDASPSVGLTFEPYHPAKAPYGQVELYEAPAPFGNGNRLGDDEVRGVVEYLMEGRRRGLA